MAATYFETLGRLHAGLVRRLRAEHGQGTVEYVGLILLIALVIGGIVGATRGFSKGGGIADAIVGAIKGGVDKVVEKGGKP